MSLSFCHSDLNGAKMHLTSVGHRNTNKISVEEFSNFRKVYSGHYHIVQRAKNFTFVGNIFQMDRSDYNNQKGIFVLDTKTGDEEFYPNMISPIFRRVYVKTEKELDDLESLDIKNDFVDLTVANSLIVGNRKKSQKVRNNFTLQEI